MQRVPQGKGLKCKMGQSEKEKIIIMYVYIYIYIQDNRLDTLLLFIIYGYITIFKSLMVIKTKFIWSKFEYTLKYILCNADLL